MSSRVSDGIIRTIREVLPQSSGQVGPLGGLLFWRDSAGSSPGASGCSPLMATTPPKHSSLNNDFRGHTRWEQRRIVVDEMMTSSRGTNEPSRGCTTAMILTTQSHARQNKHSSSRRCRMTAVNPSTRSVVRGPSNTPAARGRYRLFTVDGSKYS